MALIIMRSSLKFQRRILYGSLIRVTSNGCENDILNGSLEEEVYMNQPKGFITDGKVNMVCLLKRSIYGLKQASRQWYLKFHDTITTFGFNENIVDRCIYLKISGSKFAFLVLYVDDILIASSDLGLLRETKDFLSQNFEMKDMGDTSYVIGIEIFRDRSRRT